MRKYNFLSVGFLFFFCISYASAGLVDIKQNENILYFGFSAPNKILRYDLSSQVFLEEIQVDRVPTAMYASDQHIYLASHREVRRTLLDGTGEAFVRNTSTSVSGLSGFGGYLFIAEEPATSP